MGQTYAFTLNDSPVVREIRVLLGELSDDEAALVRALTPSDLRCTDFSAHVFDLMDVLAAVRSDEAMADYLYAIGPSWDGSIELLLVGARVTIALERLELAKAG